MSKKGFSFSFDIGDIRFTVSKSIGVRKDNKDTPLEFHTHSEFEMFFVEEEGMLLHFENREIEYQYGSIVVIPPKYTHYSFNYTSALSFSFMQKTKAKEKYYDLFKSNIRLDQPTQFKSSTEYFWVWKEVKSCFNFNMEEDGLRLKTALQLLFIKLIQSIKIEKEHKNNNTENMSYLFVIDNILNLRLSEQITLEDISRELHLSQRQISRVVRKNYGTTFSKILTEKRLSKAEILLLETDKAIADICESVGFRSESNFFTLFKKRYGETPLQYRKTRVKTSENGH